MRKTQAVQAAAWKAAAVWCAKRTLDPAQAHMRRFWHSQALICARIAGMVRRGEVA